jgi:YegS/Rv2252/BmrU family lipid kinase
MRAAVIINPTSGSSSHPPVERRVALAARVLRAAGVDHEVLVSERPGHARELAAQAAARGARIVFAWGGDGTMNEVASALAFSDAALGIIPRGSGNGLARELGLSWRPEEAIRGALGGKEFVMDAGELGGRLFFNIGGLGFDAHVAALFNALPPGRRGGIPYVTITLREVFSYRPARYRILLDGEPHDGAFLTIVLANACQFGNRIRIAPEARVDDGRLNAVLVDDRSIPAHFWRARHLLGDPRRAEGVLRRPVRHATIECPANTPCQVDGESFTAGPRIEARVHAGAIRLRVPVGL